MDETGSDKRDVKEEIAKQGMAWFRGLKAGEAIPLLLAIVALLGVAFVVWFTVNQSKDMSEFQKSMQLKRTELLQQIRDNNVSSDMSTDAFLDRWELQRNIITEMRIEQIKVYTVLPRLIEVMERVEKELGRRKPLDKET